MFEPCLGTKYTTGEIKRGGSRPASQQSLAIIISTQEAKHNTT